MLELLGNLVILADVSEVGADYFCEGLDPIITLLQNCVRLLQFLIPIGLILFGLIDLGKAVIAGKEDEMKKAQGILIKRFVYAIAVFLVVSLVYLVMGMVGDNEWEKCWNGVGGPETNEVE